MTGRFVGISGSLINMSKRFVIRYFLVLLFLQYWSDAFCWKEAFVAVMSVKFFNLLKFVVGTILFAAINIG